MSDQLSLIHVVPAATPVRYLSALVFNVHVHIVSGERWIGNRRPAATAE